VVAEMPEKHSDRTERPREGGMEREVGPPARANGSASLTDADRVLVASFEALLLAFYDNPVVAPGGAAHDRHLSQLREQAREFGRAARERSAGPEEMLVGLKAALALAAPEVRALDREGLARRVIRFAIEGYYDI
jgi:hypothetical protein